MDDEAVDTSMEDGISFAVIMGFLATLAIAIVLSLIGGAAGWVAGGGLMSTKFNAGTLIGAASGFALGGCLGHFTLGSGKSQIKSAMKRNYPPEALRVIQGLGAQSFSLYVTVHDVRNVSSSEGILAYFGKKNDSYVELRVGRKLGVHDDFTPNYETPVKRSCVQISGHFDETFKLTINPRDDTLEVALMDQDVAGDDMVGHAFVNISKGILGEGFPQQKGYKLMRQESFLWGGSMRKSGVVMLSFEPGDDFPPSLLAQLKEEFPMEFQNRKRRKDKAVEGNSRYSLAQFKYQQDYGTLMQTQWNRTSENWVA